MAELSNPTSANEPPTGNAAFYTPEFLERRRKALEAAAAEVGFRGIDEGDPQGPSGHAYGIHKSTWLTSSFREVHRKGAMDITPQEVIDVLVAAGIKNWVLMGLHGYVGYLPQPRATQDVDVMVPYNDRKKATKAIAARWPKLAITELSQVTRFMDPADLNPDGRPKPVLDLMHPWSPFQELILKEHVIIDKQTGHRLPTVEAALASKYAAIVSPFRELPKKEHDAGDFRHIVKANHDRVRHVDLRRLAALVCEQGADDIERFFNKALNDEPFSI